MIHQKTYYLDPEGNRKLVYESILNKSGQLTWYIDHQAPDKTERFLTYDESGRPVLEKEIIDDRESSVSEFNYDAQGNLINRKVFLSGELFEEEQNVYSESAHTRRVLQYGEEIELHKEWFSADKTSGELYLDRELAEKTETFFTGEGKKITGYRYDDGGVLLEKSQEEKDSHGNTVKFEIFDPEGNLLERNYFDYQEKLLLSETYDNFTDHYAYRIFNEYDHKQRLIKWTRKSESGKITDYIEYAYDEHDRIILERGYITQDIASLYRSYLNHEHFAFEHLYEEVA